MSKDNQFQVLCSGQNRALFLDRDGVINVDYGYVCHPENFEFIEGIFEVARAAYTSDYKLVVITNQSGIGRGYYNEIDFHQVNNWMLDQFKLRGINILDVFFCPHRPEDACECRKPKPGMLLKAKQKHDIDMNYSWMIGDKEADVKAANAAGINQTILVKSGHDIDIKNSNANHILKSIMEDQSVIKS